MEMNFKFCGDGVGRLIEAYLPRELVSLVLSMLLICPL